MKLFSSLAALAAVLSLFAANPSHAGDGHKMVKVGELVITGIWARTTPKTAKTGAAYFVVKNTGNTDDTLIAVSSSIAKKTEIHLSTIEGGIMKMRHVGKVAVPADGMAMLKPGGFHIMFMGLHGPINQGDQFKLTLTFEQNGSVELMVKARKAGKKGAMNHDKKTHN